MSRHGDATLSRIVQHGMHTGFVITCRRHHDDGDDRSKVECKKALHFGNEGLPPNECVRRLKNWYILGNDPATPGLASNPWTAGRYRSSHVFKFGGYRLRDLASDNKALVTHDATDEELDAMCTIIGNEGRPA